MFMVSQIDSDIPVYFLNTGYHFPETLIFKYKLSEWLGLNVIELYPVTPKNRQRDNKGNLLFTI